VTLPLNMCYYLDMRASNIFWEAYLKKTVLITGAGGLIGSLLRESLANEYQIRSLAHHPIEGVETVVADIRDMDAMVAACRGVDSIVHMAASASFLSPWEDVLQNNIIGTYTVYEAAQRAGVNQVIFASSNHAVGTYDLENAPDIYLTGQPYLDHKVPVKPDSFYGVSKCFGEDLGRYYADHHNLHVICLRIGMINKVDYVRGGWSHESFERLCSIWLSHRDMVQLIEKSLQADHIKYDIFYGISNNPHHFYDLEHAREVIGYEPQDSINERLARLREGTWTPPES